MNLDDIHDHPDNHDNPDYFDIPDRDHDTWLQLH